MKETKHWMSVGSALGVLLSVLLVFSQVDGQSALLGKIDLPTSGTPAAQRNFLEGVLYLHNFEFDDAREKFQQAQKVDPDFAMAYWGEAMTHNHPLWREVDLAAGRSALKRLGPSPDARRRKAPTEREKDFLRAVEALYGDGDKTSRDLAYHDAMAEMYEKYPPDQEVASFYALSILALTNGKRDFRNYMKAASIAEEVFVKNPRHPGAAHYLIHSYDDPVHAPLGLRAARVYAEIAPSASHAQHMISHIYVALGRWDEAVTANEKAWSVSNARVKRKGLGTGQLDFHSFFWLHYSYLQQGRYREAHQMLDTVEQASRQSDTGRLGSYYSRMRAQQVIESRNWSVKLPPAKNTFHDQFSDGLIAINSGARDGVQETLGRMAPQGAAEEVMKTQLKALILYKQGKRQEGVELLTEAASMEDEMPLTYGPPLPSKPAHELLGEVLLELDRGEEALAEFEKSLQRAPRRALSLLGLARAASRVGNQEIVSEAVSTIGEIWQRADPDLPELSELQGLVARNKR